MTYCVMDRSGWVAGSFTTEDEARTFVEKEREPDDEWVLVRFGVFANDNELIQTWEPTVTVS